MLACLTARRFWDVRWICSSDFRSTVIVCVPCQGALLSLVETQAGKLSLQPEALGADQEATNGLKHPEKRPRKGDSGPCGPQRE